MRLELFVICVISKLLEGIFYDGVDILRGWGFGQRSFEDDIVQKREWRKDSEWSVDVYWWMREYSKGSKCCCAVIGVRCLLGK